MSLPYVSTEQAETDPNIGLPTQHLLQKTFLILFRNILCPQQMFPSLRSMETQHSFCVPRVCVPKKHHEQQCVRNSVSSFASTLKDVKNNPSPLKNTCLKRKTVFEIGLSEIL